MPSEFSKKVYIALKKVPKGRLITYKGLAKAIGKPKAARAVGNALNKNPYAPEVPCHRVIKSNGDIGGYAQGTGKKKKLLKQEGIEVKNKKIIDFKRKLI